jgi:hypothetical protein
MLAPLDVCTLVGAELDDIMKTDPVAFERALTDKVRAPLRPQSIPGRFTLSLRVVFSWSDNFKGKDYNWKQH